MDEIKLKYFISVARHLSFTKAAEDCHVTQSTMSKQISALERELNVELFYRDKRSVLLTAAGANLANNAEDYMEQYRLINDSIRTLHLDFDSRLTIGVGPWESEILPPVLELFAQRHPNVEIFCTLYTHKRMSSHFRSGTFDLGICTRLCTDAVKGLYVQPFATYNFHVVAPKDSPYWDMNAEDRACLKDQMVITLYENEFEPVRPYCIKNNMKNKAFTYSNQFCTVMAMVRAKMGITLVPEFYLPTIGADMRMSDDLAVPLAMEYVVARSASIRNTAVDNFLEICLEASQAAALLKK